MALRAPALGADRLPPDRARDHHREPGRGGPRCWLRRLARLPPLAEEVAQRPSRARTSGRWRVARRPGRGSVPGSRVAPVPPPPSRPSQHGRPALALADHREVVDSIRSNPPHERDPPRRGADLRAEGQVVGVVGTEDRVSAAGTSWPWTGGSRRPTSRRRAAPGPRPGASWTRTLIRSPDRIVRQTPVPRPRPEPATRPATGVTIVTADRTVDGIPLARGMSAVAATIVPRGVVG